MTVTVYPEVMQDMAEQSYRQQVMIVAEMQMHTPPWLFEEEGWDKSRLKAAIELVCTGNVTESPKGWLVAGSKTPYFIHRDTMACPCKAAQHSGKSSVCKHRVAVELARRVQQAYPQETPLPFGPVTVDERLAQRPAFNDEDLEARDMETHHTPQEDRMPDDDAQYIPEPDDAPVAVMDDPKTTAATPRPLPGPVLLPSLEPVKIPREYTVNIKGKTHVLYTGLVVAARTHGLTSLSADWTYNDAELSLAHAVCTFADGRRYEESGDATPGNVTKGISLHFRRVALTRAKARCLRDALGISECSVEEMDEEHGKPPVPVMTPPSEQDLRKRIWAMVQAQAPQVKTREAVEAWVHQETGYTLHPDHYGDIVESLQVRA